LNSLSFKVRHQNFKTNCEKCLIYLTSIINRSCIIRVIENNHKKMSKVVKKPFIHITYIIINYIADEPSTPKKHFNNLKGFHKVYQESKYYLEENKRKV